MKNSYEDIVMDVEQKFDIFNQEDIETPLPIGKIKKIIGLMKDT